MLLYVPTFTDLCSVEVQDDLIKALKGAIRIVHRFIGHRLQLIYKRTKLIMRKVNFA